MEESLYFLLPRAKAALPYVPLQARSQESGRKVLDWISAHFRAN